MTVPKYPQELDKVGRKLWKSLHEKMEFEPWEALAVQELCRTADRMQRIDDDHAALGRPSTTVNSKGDEVTHPLIVEARMTGAAYAKLLAGLRLPDEMDVRAQRRGGARGNYSRPSGLQAV